MVDETDAPSVRVATLADLERILTEELGRYTDARVEQFFTEQRAAYDRRVAEVERMREKYVGMCADLERMHAEARERIDRLPGEAKPTQERKQ